MSTPKAGPGRGWGVRELEVATFIFSVALRGASKDVLRFFPSKIKQTNKQTNKQTSNRSKNEGTLLKSVQFSTFQLFAVVVPKIWKNLNGLLISLVHPFLVHGKFHLFRSLTYLLIRDDKKTDLLLESLQMLDTVVRDDKDVNTIVR